MSYRTDKLHNKRVNKVSYDTAVSKSDISDILDLTYEFINKKISKPIVPEDITLSEEEFNNLLPIIKVPTMGYFKPNYTRYKAIKNYKNKKKDGQ